MSPIRGWVRVRGYYHSCLRGVGYLIARPRSLASTRRPPWSPPLFACSTPLPPLVARACCCSLVVLLVRLSFVVCLNSLLAYCRCPLLVAFSCPVIVSLFVLSCFLSVLPCLCPLLRLDSLVCLRCSFVYCVSFFPFSVTGPG